MQVKTYGIYELTEWFGKLKAGSIEIEVHFTGGTASPSGARPAYYTTKDPVVQFVIENSKEFKNGFIGIESVVDLPGEHHRIAKACESANDSIKAKVENAVENTALEASIVSESKAVEEEASDNDGFIDVTVADKDDAIGYLNEHFGNKYTKTGLRNKGDFMAACAECKVNFIYSE